MYTPDDDAQDVLTSAELKIRLARLAMQPAVFAAEHDLDERGLRRQASGQTVPVRETLDALMHSERQYDAAVAHLAANRDRVLKLPLRAETAEREYRQQVWIAAAARAWEDGHELDPASERVARLARIGHTVATFASTANAHIGMKLNPQFTREQVHGESEMREKTVAALERAEAAFDRLRDDMTIRVQHGEVITMPNINWVLETHPQMLGVPGQIWFGAAARVWAEYPHARFDYPAGLHYSPKSPRRPLAS